ncbi:MAG TPA: site-2 protease family protein, partial [Patescibacteria group bacterium]
MISYLFSNPLLFIIYLFSLLVAITIHEFSHAWAADYLGDPTPRLQGRLKLNPLVHIDKIGMMFLLFFGFGWGKPVEFDPYNLKNPRRDAAWISIAGPSSNFILAIILSLLLKLFIVLQLNFLIIIGSLIFVPMIRMNIVLGVFNLLPI